LPVSLTILYRHVLRPDEAGMTIVADQAKAAATKVQLERRGYQVIKILTATFAKAMPAV
jgi:hypothetical protein